MSYDTVIVGAGMAGISAARTLSKAGKTVILLEAKSRIGGRVWSADNDNDVDTFASNDVHFPIEYGAEFIQGENAITHQLVKDAGLHTIPVDRYSAKGFYWGNPKAQPLENSDLKELIENLLDDYDDLKNQTMTHDTSLAEYLKVQKGYDYDALAKADILLAQTWCASIYTLSIQDLQQELQHNAGDEEFRIQEGYSSLVKYMSQNLEIRTSTPVVCVSQDNDNDMVVITTTSGHEKQYYTARTCIITVPVSILKNKQIRFVPELSIEKQSAINAIKMEAGTRLIYQFNQCFWDTNLTYMLHQGITTRWWTPGYGHHHNNSTTIQATNNVICSFITSDYANHIDQLSEEDALQVGLEELSILLDIPRETLQQHQMDAKRISWGHDRYICGAYAHVPPGASPWAREVLAKPVGHIFFAGEATAHDSTPQTVHGAIETGIRAANEVMDFLNTDI